MHKVWIYFDRPEELYLELTDEEYAASNDPYDYEYFAELIAERVGDHFARVFVIDDVRDVP